jgi:hypothetical protein
MTRRMADGGFQNVTIAPQLGSPLWYGARGSSQGLVLFGELPPDGNGTSKGIVVRVTPGP